MPKLGPCLLHKGKPNSEGYGRVTVNGLRTYAHRAVWERTSGAIPTGLCVLHKCDIRLCVNPRHLYLGTKQDNAQDMVRRGRSHLSKVNPTIVTHMRRLLAKGYTKTDVASMFGLHRTTVSKLNLRKNWGWT